MKKSQIRKLKTLYGSLDSSEAMSKIIDLIEVVKRVLLIHTTNKGGITLKLYEISQNYSQLLDMADVLDEQTFQDTLQAIEEVLEDKVENIGKFVRCLDADIEAIKSEEKRLADKRKALENKVASVKEYVQHEMEIAGVDKVKRPTLTVSIQLNPPSVLVKDESLIPSHYMVPVAPKLDKKAVLSFLKEGGEVPGCEIQQSKGLRIR
jgi:DNA mismatch repair ATPase MutS